ncbi:MFS transporter [Novosphingobium piscinae]|uniref:MFS transporter n=1 Tax=Novosphingobium piscinae TaxID=1507448 RepID=UPI001FECE6C1|nr:MFS transporter [Novosphingobium piscinae]
MDKPTQSLRGLCNISFGFFGIQIGFALQNANMSRIFQSLGSRIDDLPALWIAAPLTGLLVQPLIGHLSDRTWLGRLGRRRPYFLAGAVLAALSLVLMPYSSGLLMAALLLWMLDASLNTAMEPFRAFVGDMLPAHQHTAGYAIQTGLIGAGAVVGSLFPWLLDLVGVSNTAPVGTIPETVRISFWFGGTALLASVLWTLFTTREYTPAEMARFAAATAAAAPPTAEHLARRGLGQPLGWITGGLALAGLTWGVGLEQELYLLAGLLAGYGVLTAAAIRRVKAGHPAGALTSIVGDLTGMPPLMKRLALVQFLSWSAMFIMWINTTPVVAQYQFGAATADSPAYQTAANWVDVLFAVYNGVAALAALTVVPLLASRLGKARAHGLALLCGAAGFAGYLVVRDPRWLVACELGIGIAWAALLALPYAILAGALPQQKLGVFMGLFNVFIVIPQLLVATVMGTIMRLFFPTEPIWTFAFAAATMAAAALTAWRLEQPGSVRQQASAPATGSRPQARS